MKKSKDSKQQYPESRERIFRTAVTLFARYGFSETGVREIASTAHVNLSMVNYFFGSKKGLLKVILDGFLSGYLRIARNELRGKEDLPVRLERFIRRAVVYFERERESLIITISELPHDDPEILAHKAGWAKKMLEVVDLEVCRPLAAVSGHPIAPSILSPMLTSLMASRFLFTPVMEKVGQGSVEDSSTEDYGKIVVRMLLQGLLAPVKSTEVQLTQ